MRVRSLLRSCPGVSHAALAALIALAPQAVHAQAFQGTGSTTFGTVTIDGATPGVHNITVSTNRATITWSPSDTGTGGPPIDFLPIANVVNYAADGALGGNYIVLNRIIPTDTTRAVAFNGLVNSDAAGRIWFYSPGGLLIGGSASFNVGSLLLSTRDLVVDGGNDFMPVAGQFSVSGAAGSTSAIEIQAGAQIRAEALGQSNYVVAVAPRIQQDGVISVRGSAALVAAESIDFAVDSQGLFNITVQQGTEVSSNTFAHTGETGGPDSAGAGEFRRVYMVAVPKNNAVTMAIQSGGQIGFDIAGAANLDGNAIVLSAGYNIADTGTGSPIAATPAGIGPADLTVARGNYTSNTHAAALSSAIIEDNFVGGLPDIAFGSNLAVRADGQASLRANQGTVSVAGAVSLKAGFPLTGGGLASIEANGAGSVLTISGDATVDTNHDPASGPAFAGTSQLVANGGSLTVGGIARVQARATAAAVGGGGGDFANGGTLAVNAVSGGTIAINGSGLIMDAVATGGATGDTIGDVGGSGFGGLANITIGGPADAISVLGAINIDVTGVGGLAGNSGGQGGSGTGGTVSIQANGGTIATTGGGFTVVANGAGGHAGAGGHGFGGFVDVIADGGAVLTTGNQGITAMASGFGGDANSTLGDAGSGTGGAVVVEARGAGGTIETNIGGGTGGGFSLLAVAIGGRANSAGVNGGSAFGGSVTLATTGAGQSIVSHGTGNSLLETTATGNDSITSAGGNAFGGQSVLRMQGGTATFDAGLLEIRADGIGGAGQINFDGNGNSGLAQIDLSGGANLSVTGNLAVVSLARGLSGSAGGGAFGNRASIHAVSSTLTVGGSANLLADAAAGSSVSGPGGDAIGGFAEINAEAGSTIAISGGVQLTANANGGGSGDDVGGLAHGGDILIRSQDSQVRLATVGGAVQLITASVPGTGSPNGRLVAGGAFVKTDGNGYIAMRGAGSGTTGNVELLGSITGGVGIDLSVSAAGNVVFDGVINDTGIASNVSLRADNKGTGTGTVNFGGAGSISLNGAASTVDIYHNPSALGSPTDYTSNVTSATLTTYQLVRDAMQLQSINNFLGQNFALSRDIDASATAGWNLGAGFVPLGTDIAGSTLGAGFTGKFDGLDNAIIGLSINRSAINNTGLFGVIDAAQIRNVKLIDSNISGGSNTGALAGFTNGASLISNSYSSGTVLGNGGDIGGLVGHLELGGLIADSHSSATVTVATGAFSIGGLVGYNKGAIQRSWATGDVSMASGNAAVGGLVGYNDGTVTQSYATGDVSGGAGIDSVGGLIGAVISGTVDRSYATGNVSGDIAVGGFAGLVGVAGSVSEVYASGAVTGMTDVGGLVGLNDGTVSLSHWDEFSTGQASGVGLNTGTINLLDPVTSDPGQSGSPNYAFNEGAYGNFTPGEWIYFDGESRPIGAWEAPVSRAGIKTISSAHQLQLINLDLFGAYRLAHDIDLSETSRLGGVWGDAGLFPIGDFRQAFGGSFEGKGHVLSNLSINRPVGDLGLFGLSTGTIRSVGLANASVSGGNGFVGALVGNNDGLIELSFASGTVNGGGSSTGGLVGFNGNLGSIQKTYASVAVSGPNTAGGLVGVNAGTIGFSFANGAVSAPTAGGLIGSNATLAPIVNSYWDTQTSGLAQMCGSDDGSNCLNANGLTTAQTMQASSFSGWQIDANGTQPFPWRIYEGFTTPLLKGFLRPVALRPADLTTTYDTTVPSVPVVPLGYDPALIFGTAAVTGASANAGTYTLTYGGGLYSNQLGFNLIDSGQTGTLTINPAALTVTADPAARLYGDANPSFTYLSSGLLGADVLSGALDSLATVTSAVGTYAIDLGTLANPNYTITYVGNLLTVNQRPISVTADALSRNYGDANPALTFAVGGGGLVNGDVLTGALATVADGTSIVGSYAITQGTLDNTNYAISFVGGTLDVLARSITVTGDLLSRLYGDANPALTYTVGGAGLVNGDVLTGALATGATGASGIGAYAVTQSSLAASTNYAITYVGGNIDVLVRPITITADPLSRVYGDANPALTYAVGGAGLVNSDVLTGALTTAATVTSGIGAYAIAQGSLAASPNYAVTYAGDNLTITQRALAVAADPQSRIYGDADPTLTYTATGLVNGDILSGALSSGTTGVTAIGTYAIGFGTLDNPNYAIGYTSANFTVLVRPLTVTADSLNRSYGLANPALTYSVGGAGLVNGDTLTGALATAAVAGSNIGGYAIGQGTLNTSANYAITFAPGVLNVTPALLTVTANPLSRAYGDANPALTYTTSGLFGGDTLSGMLVTTATVASGVGTYAITIGSLANANYAISFAGANLSVAPRPLTISADPLSRFNGDANPALTYSLGGAGLVNGDALSGGLSTTATTTSPVGAYAIAQGSLAATANYAVTYNGADLTVLPCTTGPGCMTVAPDVARQVSSAVQQQSSSSSESEEEQEATEEQREEAASEATQDPDVVISGVIDASAVNKPLPVTEPVTGSGNSTLWIQGDPE